MYKELCKRGRIQWTVHAKAKMRERNIMMDDVTTAISTGEIVKEYTDDKPYPSCLFLGENGLHVVAAIGGGQIWIVTAYWPSSEVWESDKKTRKRVVE